MEPTSLIAPASFLGLPAPLWFLFAFKVIGFLLHSVPMSLWFTGLAVSLALYWRGGEHGRTLATRLASQMPIVVALGINFGIVPLLFLQVVYYRVFYPATILMAWPWFSVIPLLTVAYYGVYAYAVGARKWGLGMPTWRLVAGWLAVVLFVAIAYLFASAMTLMANVAAWPELVAKANEAGAVLGTVHRVPDPTFWPRFLMFIGLALATTAAYVVVDATWMYASAPAGYRAWVRGLARQLYLAGAVWFGVCGAWYTFGALPAATREAILGGPMVVLTAVTALGVLAPLAMLFVWKDADCRMTAAVIAALHLAVMAANAITRQYIQFHELQVFVDVTRDPVKMQLSPVVLFLLLFVGAVATVVWMLRRVVLEGGARAATTQA